VCVVGIYSLASKIESLVFQASKNFGDIYFIMLWSKFRYLNHYNAIACIQCVNSRMGLIYFN